MDLNTLGSSSSSSGVTNSAVPASDQQNINEKYDEAINLSMMINEHIVTHQNYLKKLSIVEKSSVQWQILDQDLVRSLSKLNQMYVLIVDLIKILPKYQRKYFAELIDECKKYLDNKNKPNNSIVNNRFESNNNKRNCSDKLKNSVDKYLNSNSWSSDMIQSTLDSLLKLYNEIENQIIKEHNLDLKKKTKDKSRKKTVDVLNTRLNGIKFHVSNLKILQKISRSTQINPVEVSNIIDQIEIILNRNGNVNFSSFEKIYEKLNENNVLSSWKNFDTQSLSNKLAFNDKSSFQNAFDKAPPTTALTNVDQNFNSKNSNSDQFNQSDQGSLSENFNNNLCNINQICDLNGETADLNQEDLKNLEKSMNPTSKPSQSEHQVDMQDKNNTNASNQNSLDLNFISLQLELASAMIPTPQDSSKLFKNIISYLNPVETPPYYTSYVCNEIFNSENFQKFHPDLLFTLFYRAEGKLSQKLSAKALKQRSWRFHTDFNKWFQRLEEPKVMTDQFEKGSYIYFDYEKWMKGEKSNFTFEYKYLEDRDSPHPSL